MFSASGPKTKVSILRDEDSQGRIADPHSGQVLDPDPGQVLDPDPG